MPDKSTAEDLFIKLSQMPSFERERFFSLIASKAFESEDYSYDDVFGSLENEAFTASEAAEYLEVSVATFRKHVKAGRISPVQTVGRSHLFNSQTLRYFKRKQS